MMLLIHVICNYNTELNPYFPVSINYLKRFGDVLTFLSLKNGIKCVRDEILFILFLTVETVGIHQLK